MSRTTLPWFSNLVQMLQVTRSPVPVLAAAVVGATVEVEAVQAAAAGVKAEARAASKEVALET